MRLSRVLGVKRVWVHTLSGNQSQCTYPTDIVRVCIALFCAEPHDSIIEKPHFQWMGPRNQNVEPKIKLVSADQKWPIHIAESFREADKLGKTQSLRTVRKHIGTTTDTRMYNTIMLHACMSNIIHTHKQHRIE